MPEELSLEFLDPLDGPSLALPKDRSCFRDVPWRWYDLLIGLLPPLTARLVMRFLNPSSLPAIPPWAWLSINLLGFAWMLGYPLVIASRRHVRFPGLPRPRAVIVEFFFGLLGVAAILLTTTLVFTVLMILLGESAVPSPPFEPVFRSPDRFRALAVMILAVSLGPVAEEFFFRGMLYNALRQRLPISIAAILQAIVFGLLHPFDLGASAVVAVIGLVLALIYEWRKTLLTPIFLHILQNTLAVSVLLWSISTSPNPPILGVAGEAHQGHFIIREVVPGTAAEAAGLRAGDVISAVDGKGVGGLRSLTIIIRGKKVGDRVPVDLLREGKPYRVEAVLKARPE
jgi:membrane protease YdiL (CAAX protease family)